ncbi:MAG: hypothetical protein AAB802_02525 [Patescibacteria group bacterium]
MKVTALLSDEQALKEEASLEVIKKLNREIAKQPFEFQDGFSAKKVRALNRRR